VLCGKCLERLHPVGWELVFLLELVGQPLS
jgi:hypothetical protein